MVSPTTLGQRLVRAKRKVRDAGIPFTVPGADELPARTSAVLDAIYAAYGTGWTDPTGLDPSRHDLTREAIRLAEVVIELAPTDPEAHGLAALLLHSDARNAARRSPDGAFLPLGDQDVRRWSHRSIERAEHHLGAALALQSIGPYQLHAAIQSVHNRRTATGRTDWRAIRSLYDGLCAIDPSIGAAVARAAAAIHAQGSDEALDLLGAIDVRRTEHHQPYWVTLAEAHRTAGHADEAAKASERALALTTDPAVLDFLQAHRNEATRTS